MDSTLQLRTLASTQGTSSDIDIRARMPRKRSSIAGTGQTPPDILYKVDESPAFYLCILFGFQHYLTMIGATVALPLLLAPALCVGEDYLGVSLIIATTFFVSGIATLLQSTIGIRLPIVQGATAAFLAPTFSLLSLPQWQCPPANQNATENITLHSNMTSGEIDSEQIWLSRMREVQGAIILSTLLEAVVGVTGLIGIVMRFVGPLVIGPTITLIGLSLVGAAADFCAGQWWIAIMTMALITAFSQYLRNVQVPCPTYKMQTGGERRCHRTGYPIFKMFPVLLAVVLAWLICAILTVTGVFPDKPDQWGYVARTDTRLYVIKQAPWFRVPYPFQWGLPTFSVAGVLGMLAGVLASMMESLGDYYACARLVGVPPPPMHAVNRGIFIEGLLCVLAGMCGSGFATTSYSENVGAIGITKVASRRVVQTGALIIILFSVIGKFGALFVTIPQPIMGGVFMIMFGMVVAVGISNLQYVDMSSLRNLFIFGVSILFGLSLPQWVNKNGDTFNTGYTTLDHVVKVLLETSMFVGGAIAFFLDNTIPGTDEERGIRQWRVERENTEISASNVTETNGQNDIYEFPYVMKYLHKWSWTRLIPISPTFKPNYCTGKEDENLDLPTTEVAERPEDQELLSTELSRNV